MSVAPKTLLDLQALWVANGGVPLGIVGDAAHQSRGSYHNGFDVASSLAGTTSLVTLGARDYSYELARDRVRSNAASAIDLGKLNGSLANLQKFSRWLVAQALADPAKYRDIREIIFSPDGKVVHRWSGPDNKVYNVPLDNAVARGHLTHTHISAHRDSELRDKRAWFAAYFTTAPSPEADMRPLASYTPGSTITVKPAANVRSDATLASPILRVVKTDEVWTIIGSVIGDKDPDGGSTVWYLRWGAGHYEFTAKSNVTAGPTAPVVGVTDCTATVDAATAPLKADVARLEGELVAASAKITNAAGVERDRIAEAEAARIKAL